jgi:hypothetical protein
VEQRATDQEGISMIHRGRVMCAAALVTALAPVGPAAGTIQACWGQASAAFAQMGLMGEHSSSFDTPRLGLRNLARALYDQGLIPDDSMQSLGVFVVDELDLGVEACSTG